MNPEKLDKERPIPESVSYFCKMNLSSLPAKDYEKDSRHLIGAVSLLHNPFR